MRPASGPAPASDPDAAAGLGAVSALRAAPSPQPAGSTGESGECPRFSPITPPAGPGPSPTTSPCPRCLLWARPSSAPPLQQAPPPVDCVPITFQPARSLHRSHPILPGFTLSLVPSVPRPRGPLLSSLATPLPRYPPLTSPTGLASAFGPLVAASARPAAGLRAAGTPSAAGWLPSPHGHPRVGLRRGCRLGVLMPSALAMTPPFSQAAASPPGTETLPLHGGALWGSR